ncbi:hypothetical protein CFP56_015747 [Quercus suber]|uniref:R13L1/DRL21-like LRR repeat region domain-containing protein n=1 Tax=Quercus suber TaxID=58331 RepID=A0AAW0KNP3_QUESU
MHLHGLKLDFGFLSKWVEEEDKRRMKNDVLVLNALEPPPYLEELTISYYMGPTVYPNSCLFLDLLTLALEPDGSDPPCHIPCHTLQEIRRFGLTVAAVGILKTIDDDIPVILEAYTTLKSDGHNETWRLSEYGSLA